MDRIVENNLNKNIHAYKIVTFNDKIFNGHFPEYPLYPAIYIIEGLCQAANIMFNSKLAVTAKLDSWKFLKQVKPGDKLEYFVELQSQMGPFATSHAKAVVSGQVVTKGVIIGKDL